MSDKTENTKREGGEEHEGKDGDCVPFAHKYRKGNDPGEKKVLENSGFSKQNERSQRKKTMIEMCTTLGFNKVAQAAKHTAVHNNQPGARTV